MGSTAFCGLINYMAVHLDMWITQLHRGSTFHTVTPPPVGGYELSSG